LTVTNASTSFSLEVYTPCPIIAITPAASPVVPSVINRNLQTATAPTDVIIPSFTIPMPNCGVSTYVMVLYETTAGLPGVEFASYNPNTLTATSSSTYVTFTNQFLLSFTHNLNTQAGQRKFRLAPKVFDTAEVAGMTSANPIDFTLNLICTV